MEGWDVNRTRALCDFLAGLTPEQVGRENLTDHLDMLAAALK